MTDSLTMHHQKKTVIVIDDEVDLTELFSNLLEDTYKVITFNKPKDFIDYLSGYKDVPFDALITDFNMPQMTGLEMIQCCLEKGYHFPFILFSAFLEKEIINQAGKIGAFRLVEKPAKKETLEKVIQEIIVEHNGLKAA